MDFNQQTVSAHGNCGARKRQDLVALSGPVAGINHDRQVAQALYRGHDAEVERVARVIGKSPDAALAQDDLVIAFAHDIFRGHEKFFERGGHATFQQHRLARLARFFEQGKILHVARANLDDVSVFFDEIERFVVNGFGHYAHSVALANFRHDLQRFEPQSLKCIRRCAWFVSSAAKEARTSLRHLLSHRKCLLPRFNGARSSDNSDVTTAKTCVGAGKTDNSVVFFYVAADQFVGLGDVDNFLHAGHLFQTSGFHRALISSYANSGPLLTRNGVSAIAKSLDFFADRAHLLFRCVCAHYDQHETGNL